MCDGNLGDTACCVGQGAAAVDGASGGVDTNPEDGITGLAQHLIGQLPQPSWKVSD